MAAAGLVLFLVGWLGLWIVEQKDEIYPWLQAFAAVSLMSGVVLMFVSMMVVLWSGMP